MKNWKNKNILITGGTSGLGRELAFQLRDQKANVVVVARNPPPPHTRDLYQNIHFVKGDIGDKNQIHRIYAETLSHLTSIDVLINNASRLGVTPLRLLLDTDCETLEDVFETNVTGPFRLTKLTVPGMILNGEGIVLNISSDAAVNAYPTWGAYGISKAALAHMTRIFQAELEGTGLKLLALDPGDMDTPLHEAAVPNADRSKLKSPATSAAELIRAMEEA